MRNASILLYGVICYVVFFLTFLYAIGFVADAPLPKTLNHPMPDPAGAVGDWIVDVMLLGLFAVQHSGMARRGFKNWLAAWMSPSIERSTYVLLTSLVLILLYWQWRPLPGAVWDVGQGWAWWLLYALSAFGWLVVLSGTFVINHFDLFGLRQVWLRARGISYTPPEFVDSFYYRIVRHPLMLGFIIAFWAIPRMSTGHLLFAIATTGYILIAVRFLEERDLIAAHVEYREYRREVPMICPWPRPKHRGEPDFIPSKR
ncbi:MAG: isoprenylcysteine carboxylmethyltransferase family protein [Xanthomonadaceae bacterium]|nr:isoprenylcysteine carboxylmethyltransferase family protein [Xanthomonadaceae bacterium]MDE2053299.1 isoprenylcysteine carboxylmethyltransferase family protein [Xanthomonadaceae bacterium]